MLAFIRNCSLNNIKSKFIIIYVLNITDVIFTLILLKTGYYMEANFLMAKVVDNHLTSFIIKVLLPAALFFYLYIRMQKASIRQLKLSNIFITFILILYTAININHLICFAILPIFMIFQ